MSLETYSYEQVPLHLIVEDGEPLTVHLIEVRVAVERDDLERVEMTVMISAEEYARIDAESLLHLTADVRGPGSNRTFRDEAPIEIEARLHPNYLTVLETEAQSVDNIGPYLIELSEQGAEHALLLNDSWYALRVKQEDVLPPELQGPGRSIKSGYNTSWIENLVKDGASSAAMSTLHKTMDEDGWNWAQGADPSTVMSRYVSDDTEDRWNIYVQVRDEESFCIVYSICPVTVTEQELPQVMEFISRANTDLPIGNFEVNHDTFEVRFKTSLDYEGGDLTPALVRQLLRANAAMTERYLPGLKALVEDAADVLEALRLVEE